MNLKKLSPAQIWNDYTEQETQIKLDAGLQPNDLYTLGGIETTVEVTKLRMFTVAKMSGVLMLPPAGVFVAYKTFEMLNQI
jgi:hypothetical protein